MMSSLIVDTDGGIDDALAILTLIGSGQVKIKLINAVAGNVDNVQACKNIKALLDLCNARIQVSIGRNSSFSGRRKRAYKVHGADGLGNTFLSRYVKAGRPRSAGPAFRKAIGENRASKILAIGPLTNIAQVILKYPYLVEGLDEIWVMGGTFKRKAGSAGEFNFCFDPEAVEILLQKNILIKLVTIDTAGKVLFGNSFIENFRSKEGDIYDFILHILEFSYIFSRTKRGLSAAVLPDLVTACLFLDENLADFKRIRADFNKKTGRFFKSSGGREIILAENLNQKKIKEKALNWLLELKERKN